MTGKGTAWGLALAAWGLALPLAAAREAPVGTWPSPRQNRRLTAFQPLPGAMRVAPEVRSQVTVGEVSAALVPFASRPGGAPDRAVALPDGRLRCYDLDGKLLWEVHPEGLNFERLVAAEDLDGDGRVELALTAGRPQSPLGAALLVDADTGELRFRYDVEPMSYSWALHIGAYLPGVRGQQLVVLMQGYPPDKKNGYLALFEFPQPGAAPRQRWRYDFDEYTAFPSLLTSDVDGNGVKELCVQTHSRMWVLDAPTGRVKQFLRWSVAPGNNRSYGLIRFQDLNGDGREDFFCIANFAQHHEVLLNEDGKLRLAWARGWADSVTTASVATIWAEPPIADVDGDGKLEMVLSMYRADGEPRWVVRVYDVLTGEVKALLPDRVATDLQDLDGDGIPEILTEITRDPTRAEVTGMVLYRRTAAEWRELWRAEGARSGTIPPGSRQGGARQAPLPSADTPVLVQTPAGMRRLAWDGERGPHLVEYRPPPASGPDLSRIQARAGLLAPAPLVADLDADGRNEVIVHVGGTVTVYSYRPEAGLVPRASFRSDASPAVADLNGDGRLELVVGTASADSPPHLSALRLGQEQPLWEVTLHPERPGIPHGRPLYFQTGRFTGARGDDLYVLAGTPVLRSMVLDGRTGSIVWEKAETPGLKERYFGPTSNHAAVWDFNGDGKDDLVFSNPDYYCVASGPTGELLLGPSFPPEIFKQPSQGLYTFPALLEHATGDPTVCLVDGHYFQAAMTLRAQPHWYRLPETGEARSGAEGFLRLQDGTWLLGFGRQDGRFSCVEALTGRGRWELPLEGAAGPVSSCDIDGDGQPEFLFGTSHGTLYAVADAGSRPRVLWKTRLPGSVGMPVAADVTGSGKSEILVAAGDGRLYLLTPPLRPGP